MFIQRTDKFYIDWGKKVGVFEYSEHGVQIIPLAKTILSISKLHILSECLRSCLYNQPSFIFTWLKASSLDLFIQPINKFKKLLIVIQPPTKPKQSLFSSKYIQLVAISFERFISEFLWWEYLPIGQNIWSFGHGFSNCVADCLWLWIVFQKNDRRWYDFAHADLSPLSNDDEVNSSILHWLGK